MLEFLREIVEKFLVDPSVIVSAVYRADGVPVETRIRDASFLNILSWLEEQIRVLVKFTSDRTLKSLEFKTDNYFLLIFPLTRALILAIVSTSESSIYKLKIDAESLRRGLNV